MGIMGQEGHVIAIAGKRHADGADLMQAAIRGILQAGQWVKTQFAGEGAPEVVGDPLLLVVHGESGAGREGKTRGARCSDPAQAVGAHPGADGGAPCGPA